MLSPNCRFCVINCLHFIVIVVCQFHIIKIHLENTVYCIYLDKNLMLTSLLAFSYFTKCHSSLQPLKIKRLNLNNVYLNDVIH